MKIEISKVNEILSHFKNPDIDYLKRGEIDYYSKVDYELVATNEVKPFIDESGHEGQWDFVFQVEPELFVKVSVFSDSYGEERGWALKFVQPVTKTVTDYE